MLNTPTDDDDDVQLISYVDIRRDLQKSDMTLVRWDQDPRMIARGWPPKIQIGRRNYKDARKYRAFKRAGIQDAQRDQAA